MTTLIGYLLAAALIAAWRQRCLRAEPVITVCHRCGDLVQHAPDWPSRCPSCRAILI
jgi:predicted Zn-ribbon and HTH transcriptional regulator